MNLISKKDLLSLTGISYGQLYRWKRERLIPEEWFSKQSAFTGQETFFPREQVLERVKSILAMKDTHSLEELAKILSSEGDTTISAEAVGKLEGFDRPFLSELTNILGKGEFTLVELGFAWGISLSTEKKPLTDAQCRDFIRAGAPLLAGLQAVSMFCTLFECGNAIHVSLSTGSEPPVFDSGVGVIAAFSLDEMVSSLKTKLRGKTEEQTKKIQGDEYAGFEN